jgi:hypothetical protein
MPVQSLVDELELLVRSRYGLIVVDSLEDDRVEDVLRHVASRLSLHYYVWRRTKGVARGGGMGDPFANDTADPAAALGHAEREGAGIYHFPGLSAWLDDPTLAWRVRDVVDRFGSRRGSMVISGSGTRLPELLRQHAVFVRMPAPGADEYRALFERLLREHQARMQLQINLTPEERTRLLYNLKGLSLVESEKILTRIIIEDGLVNAADIARVAAAKRKVVEQEGLLEYWAEAEPMSAVAGMDGLKAWLGKRRIVVDDPDGAARFGLPFPKGMLLLGVPGCGKSLCAKAVASEWGLPLLRLDPGALYNKYVGDSEKNFRQAMHTAERMAPAVLWIDEIEKAFSQNGGEQDGGVSQRVFGSFLSWLQERRGDVFVVATSNDVSRLPAEFIRKGRFDEVFFVDLPSRAARAKIFAIHLAKRNADASRLDLAVLSNATAGFSGAEIEQIVISGLFSAFAEESVLTTDLLIQEITGTHPLARTMSERLAALRAWARDRTVNADNTEWRGTSESNLKAVS